MYTRQGDKGETGLYGPRRVPKDSPRVEAYGAIDELNSCIGLSISFSDAAEVSEPLRRIQKLLFVAGADLAADQPAKGQDDKVPRIKREDTEWLELASDEIVSMLPRITNFILPGGTQAASALQVARAVCRRAERRIVTAGKSEEINRELLPFFNRLSTFLFNVARLSNSIEGKTEETWKTD